MEIFKDSRDLRNRKNRPKGTIISENLYEKLLIDAKWLVSNLKNEKGVIGITLSGGLSRGYGDELSEIDLMIYLEKETHKIWSEGKGPIPQGDILWYDKYFDLKFFSYEDELEKEWNLLMKWDASYNVILFDTQNKIRELLEIKDIFTAKEKYDLAFNSDLDVFYKGNLMIDQWNKRGDLLAARQSLNGAIRSLIKLLFLVNDEYTPVEKWALNYSYSLDWKPVEWKSRIESILNSKIKNSEELMRIKKELIGLHDEVWVKLMGSEYKSITLIEIRALKILQYIVDNSPLLLKDYEKEFELRFLAYEPIYNLTKIDTVKKKEVIIFNKNLFLKEKENGFQGFLDWNKAILKKIIIK